MSNVQHSDLSTGVIHIVYNWTYADATARTSATGFVTGDIGKLARQLDNNTLWMLTATTPTWVQVGSGATGSAGHAYYTYLASLLEPDAIEPIKLAAFSYAIGSTTTKYCLASFNTRLGSSGRFEVRDPAMPIPLRNVTMTGIGADSCGIFMDPSLPSYTDARTTYFDRLNTLATSATLYLPISTTNIFLPGAYGAILVAYTNFDSTWVVGRVGGSTFGWNLANEVSDTTTQRNYNRLNMAVNKGMVTALANNGSGSGGFIYYLVPSTWSAVTDSTSYNFRDDFMGASLDTTTKWTRAQSTTGNVEIDTAYQWCKVIGDGSTWGANGAYSQTSVARANGKKFMCDVNISYGSSTHNLVVGWSDGAGQSYTNFAHGLDFTGGGLQVFENGTSRGTVGSGYVVGTTYRVRITLGASNNATYEIQSTDGVYAALGGSSWTSITPGTSSSSTTPLHAGFTRQSAGTVYISDVKIF